jgi:hypothetical protein
MRRRIHKDRVQLRRHLQELIVKEVDMTEDGSEAGINVIAVLFQEEELQVVELHCFGAYNRDIGEGARVQIRGGRVLEVV